MNQRAYTPNLEHAGLMTDGLSGRERRRQRSKQSLVTKSVKCVDKQPVPPAPDPPLPAPRGARQHKNPLNDRWPTKPIETAAQLAERMRIKLQRKREARAILAAEGVLPVQGRPDRPETPPAKWLRTGPGARTAARVAIYDTMVGLDATLVSRGHRRLTESWRLILERWLCKSNALTLTIRKGRRVGASTIIAPRIIVSWIRVVLPRLDLPPGEIVVVGLVSVRRGEAANRIAQIAAVMTACNMPHRAKGDEIEMVGAPIRVRVLTKNWRSAVGENIGLLWCDEVSRWESEDSSANPASEVIGSLKPTLATLQTMGYALMVLSSSPWSEDDYHAKQYDRGDTEDQCTAFLPTWEGNPTLSEKQTHLLEPDERVWAREYAAIPGNVLSQALDQDDVNAAFGMVVPVGDLRRWCCIDASSLRGDAFAWMVGHEARGGLVADKVSGWSDQSMRELTLDTVVAEIAGECRARGITRVWGDQREEAGLQVLFRQQGIAFESFAWSNGSKHDAFTMLRRLLRDRRVQLLEHAELRTQMRSCKARLLPGGLTSYETNGLDYLSALITLLHGYEQYYPQALSQILSGRILAEPVSADEAARRLAEEQRAKFRREAEKRARRHSTLR